MPASVKRRHDHPWGLLASHAIPTDQLEVRLETLSQKQKVEERVKAPTGVKRGPSPLRRLLEVRPPT